MLSFLPSSEIVSMYYRPNQDGIDYLERLREIVESSQNNQELERSYRDVFSSSESWRRSQGWRDAIGDRSPAIINRATLRRFGHLIFEFAYGLNSPESLAHFQAGKDSMIRWVIHALRTDRYGHQALDSVKFGAKAGAISGAIFAALTYGIHYPIAHFADGLRLGLGMVPASYGFTGVVMFVLGTASAASKAIKLRALRIKSA